MLRIESVRFHGYKAFRDYSIPLEHVNILVGRNNSGKSTIIGAFRTLAVAMRRAAVKSPQVIDRDGESHFGYDIPPESVPTSLENVHTDYEDRQSSVEFMLSSGDRFILIYPRSGGVVFVVDSSGASILSPAQFRRAFPLSISVVPVLGPLEHNEPIVKRETVIGQPSCDPAMPCGSG